MKSSKKKQDPAVKKFAKKLSDMKKESKVISIKIK